MQNPRGRHRRPLNPSIPWQVLSWRWRREPLPNLFSDLCKSTAPQKQSVHRGSTPMLSRQADRQTDTKKYMPRAVSKHPTITEKKQSRRGRPQGPRWLTQGLFRRMCSWAVFSALGLLSRYYRHAQPHPSGKRTGQYKHQTL